jgi:hypothetical protein
MKYLPFGVLFLATLRLSAGPAGDVQKDIAGLPVRTRAEMIAAAKTLADHAWIVRKENLVAACVRNYDTSWKAGQKVQGLPYNWGGVDDVALFDKKIARGLAAGAHSRHGVTQCTAGVDCSGFIALCWGLRTHRYTTRNIRDIAGRPKYNWFTDMKPGDALNKAGSHIVLFAGYNPDGTINIFEASGSANRVVFHKVLWSRVRGYLPVQYKMVDDN